MDHPDFESAIDAVPVRLDNFEGPLDLLLYLIKKNEVSIYDIPIALITALALAAGSKIASHFSHRGYNGCANLLRKTLPERDIAIKLNPDAVFEFPYGDGYWSKLLNRSYHYEDELALLFRHSADVDYTLIDCGANYGYWSVLVSSQPFGSHKAIAIEPAAWSATSSP